MPTYDYKCLECNHTFEEFQKITDSPLETCPSCGGKLKRMIGPGVAPIFKGSGFYQTDYKSNSGKSSNSESVKSNSKPTDAKDGKKESKNKES